MKMSKPLLYKGRLYKVYQKVDRKGGGLTVLLQEMDPETLADVGEPLPFGSLPYKVEGEAESYVLNFDSSLDSSFLAFALTGFKDDDNQASVLVMVANDKLEPVWSKVHSIPVKAGRLLRTDVAVDGNGNVHVGYVEYAGGPASNVFNRRRGVRLFQLNAQEAKEVEIRLPSGRSPENIALCSVAEGIAVGGYATKGSGSRDEILSTFFGHVKDNGTILEVSMETELAAPIGGWASEVYLLPKSSGGFFLVGAVVPVPVTRAIHVQSISSSMSSDWQQVIPRKHGSIYGQDIFMAYAKEDKLCVVFEETAKNIARLIAGEEVGTVSDLTPKVICRADMGEDGTPTYVAHEKGVGNGKLETMHINRAYQVGNGEQVVIIPVKEGETDGPIQIGYFEFEHGDPVESGK